MADQTETSAASDPVNLRAARADRLFADIPEMAEDMETRPQEGEAALAFLDRLLKGDIPEEAVTFAAYALKPRHAVWWGHECLNALPDSQTDQDREMLALCAAWAADPGEETRYAALNAAESAGERGPGVWLAYGAGWSGGSMADPDQPEVPCPAFATGRAVGGGVLSFLARTPQDRRRRTLGHFVSMAVYLAKGG